MTTDENRAELRRSAIARAVQDVRLVRPEDGNDLLQPERRRLGEQAMTNGLKALWRTECGGAV